jgi:hypothetical protein
MKTGSTVYQSRLNCLRMVIQLIMDAQSTVDEKKIQLFTRPGSTVYENMLHCLSKQAPMFTITGSTV